jgi:hypothetical protein
MCIARFLTESIMCTSVSCFSWFSGSKLVLKNIICGQHGHGHGHEIFVSHKALLKFLFNLSKELQTTEPHVPQNRDLTL